MRDLGVLLSLLSLAGLALWRPWLGVLGLVFFGYLQPHSYTNGFMSDFPVYRTLFAATVVGALFTRDRRLPPGDWRVFVLLALWLTFFISTKFAGLPFLAWPKLLQVSMVLASTFLIPILINTREKLFWLITAMALSFALVAFKGGYWTIIHGFTDRVHGPPGSQYADNNHFAVAAVMTIPLLVLWFRQSSDHRLKGALTLAITLSAFATLSSWSRGGLLALLATVLMLILSAGGRRGGFALIALLGALLLASSLMPEKWFERMETIGAYQSDGSAQGRFFAWERGSSYALASPLVGGGFDGWVVIARGRDWHSAYIEILAEHGMVAFALWISLILGTLVWLVWLGWRHRGRGDSAWVTDYSTAIAASLVGYCVGGAFLGIAYWDLLYHLIAASIVLRALATEWTAEHRVVKVDPDGQLGCPAQV